MQSIVRDSVTNISISNEEAFFQNFVALENLKEMFLLYKKICLVCSNFKLHTSKCVIRCEQANGLTLRSMYTVYNISNK